LVQVQVHVVVELLQSSLDSFVVDDVNMLLRFKIQVKIQVTAK